jgi:hypothetical protein
VGGRNNDDLDRWRRGTIFDNIDICVGTVCDTGNYELTVRECLLIDTSYIS